jgi:hypothetical protein
MGILNFFWGQSGADTTDVSSDESTQQECQVHTMHNVSFQQADLNLYVKGGTGNRTECVASVDNSILKMLESSIIEFIQKDYPFETIPFDPKVIRKIPEHVVCIDPHHQVKTKVHMSDTDYVMKSLHHLGFTINIHTTADVIIEKVTFMYKEVDGQLINGPQMIKYTTPMITNITDELVHWTYFD